MQNIQVEGDPFIAYFNSYYSALLQLYLYTIAQNLIYSTELVWRASHTISFEDWMLLH